MLARELINALRNKEVGVGCSFGVADEEALAQMPAWRYLMAVRPIGHELAAQPEVSLLRLVSFPLLSCSKERLPGWFAQMRATVRKHTLVLLCHK